MTAPLSLAPTFHAHLPELALSVRQPWPWAMRNAGKDIENRDWSTTRRGRVCIHAGKAMTLAEYHDCTGVIRAIKGDAFDLPGMDELPRGGIVGTVEIVDVVTDSASPWFFGRYGFVLKDFRPVPFVECKGALGFFKWRNNL